jgi:hypothetical protein
MKINKKGELSAIEMSEIIYENIKDEKFIDKPTMIIKIKSVISLFRFRQNGKSYDKEENPTRYARLLRENERLETQLNYWKRKVKEIDPENLPKYYQEADELERIRGFRQD